MQILIALLSVLAIPRYGLRFMTSVVIGVLSIILIFNVATLIVVSADFLTIIVNFFRYGLNETSILLLLIATSVAGDLVVRAYLRDVGRKDIDMVAWTTWSPMVLVGFTGAFLPVVLAWLGVNEFGGASRIFTDVMLFLALALSVYSVGRAGAQIEPATRVYHD